MDAESDLDTGLIQYRKREIPEDGEPFYHPDCHLLMAAFDTVGSPADCPFPLKTDIFGVKAFGDSSHGGDGLGKFALVEFTKRCGHTVRERVGFIEGVEDFEHFGTRFIGADYGIANWERRIRFFRDTLACDICHLVERALWIYRMGMVEREFGGANKEKRLKSILHGLECAFTNWRDILPEERIAEMVAATRWNSQ